ncbi:MAG: PIN domain-containing protein [Bacteroidia bacterium]
MVAKEFTRMNGKNFSLDTNIVIALFAEDKNVIKNIEKAFGVFVPIIVLGELLYGAELSSRKSENIKKLDSFSKSCEIIYLTYHTATVYGNLKAALKKKPAPRFLKMIFGLQQ